MSEELCTKHVTLLGVEGNNVWGEDRSNPGCQEHQAYTGAGVTLGQKFYNLRVDKWTFFCSTCMLLVLPVLCSILYTLVISVYCHGQ